MRKATLVSGIIVAAIIFLGVLGKLFHLPYSSLLLVFGFCLMMISFLPLLFIFRLKNDKTVLQKVAAIFGFIVGWLILFPGLLFSIQRWPGGTFLVLVGIIGGLGFLVLFFLSANKAHTPVNPKAPFNIIVAIILITLFGGRYFVRESIRGDASKKIAECEVTFFAKQQLEESNHSLYMELISDTTNPEILNSVKSLEKSTADILRYINHIRGTLIAYENGVDQIVGDTTSICFVQRPTDYDMTTHHMIGNDPANITGESKPLKAAQIKYYVDLVKSMPQQSQKDFASRIKKNIPVDVYIKDEEKLVSWEFINFYHKTIIETLTTLQQLQINILNAEKLALEEIQKSSKK